jgi:hypothetical protein
MEASSDGTHAVSSLVNQIGGGATVWLAGVLTT